MTLLIRLFALTALLLSACSSQEEGLYKDTAVPALSAEPPLEIGGVRKADVHYPEDYDVEKSYPLVILLHGFGANAELQNLIFQLKKRVDKDQFILVMPNGTQNKDGSRFWNAMPECCDFDGSGIDDVAYLTGLIDEALDTYAVDPARVSLIGHSNGGYMAYRMACETPERLDRIAVLAGSVFLDETDCRGEKPVSVLHIHGTHDDVVPYANNLTEDTSEEFRLNTVGAEEAIERWRVKAACDAAPQVLQPRDYLLSVGGLETDVFEWTGCAEGTDVILWRMREGDHLALAIDDRFRDAVAAFLLKTP